MFEIVRYTAENGRRPFEDWFSRLRDKAVQARVITRLHSVESGSLGDCAPVGEGVFELRLHFGPGYRIYCGQSGDRLVILLCGGDKSTQQRDIRKAKEFWTDWKRRQP